MRRNSRFSREDKIQACEDYKSGKGSFNSIADAIGVRSITIQEWYSAYSYHGVSAFSSSKKNNSYTRDFKNMIVKHYLEKTYTTMELSGKYNISLSMVKRWIKKYNDGIALKDYIPKGEVYTMKSRKTTFEERLEIVKWVIANDMSYKDAADKYGIKYALVYQWVQKYFKNGSESLKHKKRGPRSKTKVDESSLSELEKLKLELEKERHLRERAELKVEILKKKKAFEKKLRSRK